MCNRGEHGAAIVARTVGGQFCKYLGKDNLRKNG